MDELGMFREDIEKQERSAQGSAQMPQEAIQDNDQMQQGFVQSAVQLSHEQQEELRKDATREELGAYLDHRKTVVETAHPGEAGYRYRKEDSVKATQREMWTIADKLSDQSVHMHDKDRAKFEVRQERSLSHLLVNSTKFMRDSQEMTRVKECLKLLENALRTGREDANVPMSKAEIEALEVLYFNTIDECKNYLTNKNKDIHNERYAMVLNRMEHLMDELALLGTMKELVAIPEYQEYLKVDCPDGLLVGAKLLAMRGQSLKGDSQEKSKEKKGKEEKRLHFSTNSASLERFDKPTQEFLNLLTLKSNPSNYIRKTGDDNQCIAVYLLNLLKSFPEGVHTVFFNSGTAGYSGGEPLRLLKDKKGKIERSCTYIGLKQDEDGTLSVILDAYERKAAVLPFRKEEIIRSISINFLENEKKVGSETVDDAIDWVEDPSLLEKEPAAVRDASLKLIFNRTGVPAMEFDNVPTEKVSRLAHYCRAGVLDTTTARRIAAGYDARTKSTAQKVNSIEPLENLKVRNAHLDEVKEQITFLKQEEKKDSEKKEKKEAENKETLKWTQEEQEARNLLADLVFSKDTWKADDTLNEPGVRMQNILVEHSHAFLLLVRNKDLVSSMIRKLPFPEQMATKLSDMFEKIRAEQVGNKQIALNTAYYAGWASRDAEDALVQTMLKTDAVKECLIAADQAINETVDREAEKIQGFVSKAVESLFQQKDDEKPVNMEELLRSKKGLTSAQKTKIEEKGNDVLKSIAKEALFGKAGQGLFLKLILSNYFGGVSSMDKRAMLASMIREAEPSSQKVNEKLFQSLMKEETEEIKEAQSPEQIDEEEELNRETLEIAGKYIGGLFKGAGPLFQKFLQGVPKEALPKELHKAFDDVKSNLLPIPQEIVEAQLYSMVQNSKGKITKIEIVKPLGAASVGQAFECKIYGPSLSNSGDEVVVKLLRPDVRNRMMREKKLMLSLAYKTNPGMGKTYEGQLERIEEELDLTIEARNVQRGQIYDKKLDKQNHTPGTDDVVSMKLHESIRPTKNSLVIVKSEGETVDKYIRKIQEQQAKLFADYVEVNEEGKPIFEDGVLKLKSGEIKLEDLNKLRAGITKLYEEALKRQKHLANAAQKWSQEGLFGDGFYHGDLHAGNILVSESKATIIDFGNATQLDRTQKEIITKMMCATVIGDVDAYRHGFHLLMKTDQDPEKEAFYQSKRAQFTEELQKLFMLGSASSAGLRIWDSLLKAQELGLELPAAIFNFSQCQIRIQNTIEEMNQLLSGMKEILNTKLKSEEEVDGDSYDSLKGLKVFVKSNPNYAEAAFLSVRDNLRTVFLQNSDFISYLEKSSKEDREEFDALYLDYVEKESVYDELINYVLQYHHQRQENPNLSPLLGAQIAKDSDFIKLRKEVSNETMEQLLVLINDKDATDEQIEDLIMEYKVNHDFPKMVKKFRAEQDKVISKDKDALSPEQMKELAEKVQKSYKKYVKKSLDANGVLGNFDDSPSQNASLLQTSLMANRIKTEYFESDIKPYFKDPKYGTKLEADWKLFEKESKANDKYAESKEGDTLIRSITATYAKIQLRLIFELKGKMTFEKERKFSEEEPDNFNQVMDRVLNDNILKALRRLGFWGLWHSSEFKDAMG